MAEQRMVTCFRESPDAWQTKIQAKVGLSFPLPWLIIALFLGLIGAGIVKLTEEEPSREIWFPLAWAVLVAAIANAVVFYERLMDELADCCDELIREEKERIQQWLNNWYRKIFWSKTNLWFGLGLATLLVVINVVKKNSLIDCSLYKKWYSVYYLHFLTFVIGFVGGSMLWTMIGIARMMASIGRDLHVRASIFDAGTSPLRTASVVLWKVSVIATLVYALAIAIYMFSRSEFDIASITLDGIFGVFLLLYFIVPQWNMHTTLVRIKRRRMRSLVSQIDKAFDTVTGSPTPENINRLRDLFNLQKVVNGKSAWSFGTNELLVLMGSIIIPLILFLLGYWRRQ